MTDFFYRTEDIKQEEILDYFVETAKDREILTELKARKPVILAGSRGVGKSFLLRVAETELRKDFEKSRVFPIYVSFNKSSLIHSDDKQQFQHWMLAKICTRIVRGLSSAGLLATRPPSLAILTGGALPLNLAHAKIAKIATAFEETWKNPGTKVDTEGLPSIDTFKDAVEDLCAELGIDRLNIFIDEAAHIFRPEQQRQFFTLYRDLRSPQLSCNAAIYPGVTAFGPSFQPAHDATMLTLDRNVLDAAYIPSMREIVERQAESDVLANIVRNGQNFATLAYAAFGNPRLLLKTIGRAPKLNSQQVNEVIREYYRTDIWAEHSGLTERYAGHKSMIDWGRNFIETVVLTDLQSKNTQYLKDDGKSTCYFWIHRDAPEPVKEALRLLAYTGIVTEHSTGIKATRAEIGVRYAVNLGCLFALEAAPAATAFPIAKNLTPKRMSEYGANHAAYNELLAAVPSFTEPDMSAILVARLAEPLDVLDITDWQKKTLRSINLKTVSDVLGAREQKLMEASYVGEKRSRRMRNAAIASVLEYLSG